MPHPAGSSGPPLAAFDALHEAGFRRFWLSGVCVNTARWMDLLVLGWVALELTNSPLLVALAAFCRSVPMMALGLFAGMLADRFDRLRVIVLVQLLNFGLALVLALLFATSSGGFWQLAVVETLLGVGWAIDQPSRRTALFTLVGPGRLTNAMSLEMVSVQGTKMVGPIVGGLLLARVGPSGCYIALAILSLCALLWMLTLSQRTAVEKAENSDSVPPSLVTGFRELRAQPTILQVLVITVIINMLVFPYQTMLPVLAREVLAVGPDLLGLLVAANGFGSLAGALMLASRYNLSGQRQVFVGGSLLVAALAIGLGLSPWYLLSLSVQFLIGVAESGFGTMQNILILLSAPERSRGRAMGALSACVGTHPFGILWIGFLANRVGVPLAVVLGGVIGLALMLPVATRMLALVHPTGHRSSNQPE